MGPREEAVAMTDDSGFTNRDATVGALSALREVSDIMLGILVSLNPDADPPEAPDIAIYARREYGRIKDEAERLREEIEDLTEPEVMVRAALRWDERDRRERDRQGGDAE
jgi:hypothetical protein